MRPVAILLVIAAAAGPSRAAAQESEVERAERLFDQGRAAAAADDCSAAIPSLRESHELDPGAGTLLYLALCEEKVGALLGALAHWREALALLAPDDERRAEAERRARELLARVPRLTVTLTDAPPGARVLRDGVALAPAALGVAEPVDPGEHVIEASAPGRTPIRHVVRLAERTEQTVLVALPAVAPPPPETPAPEGGGRRTLAFVLGGAGLAGAAVAAITGAMVLGRQSVLEEQCDAQKRCSPAGLEARDQLRPLLLANTVGTILGVVGVGACAVLLLASDDAAPPRRAVVRTSLRASVTPGAGALWVSRSF